MGHNEARTGIRECPRVESYNPAADEQLADPFPAWRTARRETPVFFSPVLDAYVVTRYEDLCEVMGDPAVFSSAGILKPLKPNPPEVDDVLARGFEASKLGAMVMLDPPEHSRTRKSTAAAFTPRRVAKLEEEIRAVAEGLIDSMVAAGPPADFVEAYAYPLPLQIIMRLLGVPPEDAARLHQWASFKMALQWGDMALEDHLTAAEGFVDFQRYVQALVTERRADPQDDLISAIVELRSDDDEPLDDGVIVGQVMGLVNAGHETVTAALTTGLHHLLQDRRQWDKLCADPGLSVAATEEALRFDGPAKQLWRRTTRATKIGGHAIPANARIAVVLGSANRDEDVFEDPERFDLAAKRSRPNLAFGRGIHYCVGASLARSETRIAFERLAVRLPSLRLAPGSSPAFARNVAMRMPISLAVQWET